MKKVRAKNHRLFTCVIGLFMSAMIAVSAMTVTAPLPVYAAQTCLFTYTVKVESGYLALRTRKEFNKNNEIGRLDTGDIVVGCPTLGDEGEYMYVYSSKLRKHGYVNANYLYYAGSYDGRYMYACVETGYLALRNAKAYEKSNEIGKLYTGDSVVILDDSGSEYWTVYSPTLYKTGYVNRNYLVYSYTPEPENTLPMVFPDPAMAEWETTSDNYLSMHVQVKNNTRSKAITAFTLLVCSVDQYGNIINDGNLVHEFTMYKTIEPGKIEYSSDFYLACRNYIRTVCVQIRAVRFSDGTWVELPTGGKAYAEWTVY